MEEQQYLDWNNSFEILDKAHEEGIFVLIIGPKGTGKTCLVREYAKRKSDRLLETEDIPFFIEVVLPYA